jgi:hypothetical protein
MRKSYHPNGHDNCIMPSFIIYIEDSREGKHTFSTTYDIYVFIGILDCALLGYFVMLSINLMQHYVIKFVSVFSPPIKLTTHDQMKYC